MSQVLKSLQLVTQSYNETPSTGTGALFASGSTLYFENTTGTLFPLGLSGGGSGYLIVREYTGSAPGGGTLTSTWNNNSSIRYIQVICVGAGGGGGSGAFGQLISSTRLQGGAGGGGGAIAWGFFDSASLTQANYPISIGAGGAGGIARLWENASRVGFSGSVGQYTTFGDNMVSASGGFGGTGGSTAGTSVAGGAGGLATLCRPGPGFAIPGGTGASTPGNGTNASNAVNFFSTPLTPTATAGGGSSYNINLAGVFGSGSLGAGGYQWNTLITNNTIEGGSGSAGIVAATVLLQFTSSLFNTIYGLGGGGNGVVTPNNYTVAGGHGGFYGAGGGGAGYARGIAQITTQPGGSGSSGLCIVVEYY
jgi:hypothetical protein